MLKNLFLSIIIAILMIGCSSASIDTPVNDKKAKQFNPPINNAGIYIYRNNIFNAVITMDVKMDGKYIGKSTYNTYLYKEVSPGKHIISSKAENTSSITIDAKAGKLYYIWQEVEMGILIANTKFHLINENKAQIYILENKLSITK